jgi:Tfp pilus assembly protein PilP
VVNAALILLTALTGLSMGPSLMAQTPQDTAQAQPAAVDAQDAIYRREVFVYPTSSRRNPFVSLLTLDDAGPQFENLDLVGIIFGGSAGSVAALVDRATDKRYRVRRGDIIGDSRVVEIRPDAVVFQVTEFGLTRSETLRIRKEEEEQG